MSDLGNKKIMARNIQYYLELNHKDRNDLVRDLGFKYTTISNWLQGLKYPRIDKIEILANYFGINKSDLVEEHKHTSHSSASPFPDIPAYIPLVGTPVPIIGSIAAGVPISAQQDVHGYAVPADRVKADFALRVKGDSMVNVPILDGDIVFIRQQPEVENGEIAAVQIDGEATLKRFYKRGDSISLVAENPDYAPMVYTAENCEEFRILGKAVAYQHSFEVEIVDGDSEKT